MSSLRLGTRGSTLALIQADAVAAALGGAEVVTVRTADDAVGDKARFVRGVEQAILDGEVDLGVHSAKDLPGELPDGLALVGVPGREDPTDAFIGAAGVARRAAGGRPDRHREPAARAPSCSPCGPTSRSLELRGNVDTRLAKLAAGGYDGIVLASAGLARLGRDRRDLVSLRARRADPGGRARAASRSRRAPTTSVPSRLPGG